MAQENIEITNPNFCLTPQAGTFGTINTDDTTTLFRVKNTAGGLVNDYTLSANILNQVLAVEYVGPTNLAGAIDNVTFFTLEKVSSTRCIIKRWELDVSFSLLSLKQQIVKYTTGNYYYNATAMAIEHYDRSFLGGHQGGINYIDMSAASRIENAYKLFLGPSTDSDNVGATETVTVNYRSGNRVYLSGNTTYQYVSGDPITFYNNIYLFSNIGYGGDTRQGTLFQLDAYTGGVNEYTNAGVYTDVTGAKWSKAVESVATINGNQMLYVRPYDSYLNWRSMYLDNVESNDKDTFDVYDVVFDNYNIYKLALFTTRRDDAGAKTTYSWSTYNYQQDTILPYTSSVTIYTEDDAILIGQTIRTTITLQVRDQFGVTLRDVDINLYDDGADAGAEFDPENGQAITDTNGLATIDYISGAAYTGLTEISVRADGSSSLNGSDYVWNMMRIESKVSVSHAIEGGGVFQLKQKSDAVRGRQLHDPFKTTRPKRVLSGTETTVPPTYIICHTYFTTEGGNWIEGGNFDAAYWPGFDLPWGRTDGPNTDGGGTWTWEPYPPDDDSPPGGVGAYNPRPNKITQVLDFTQKDNKELIIKSPTWFWTYYPVKGQSRTLGAGQPVDIWMKQLDAEYDLQLSQLKLSKHTHYVDGSPYDYLWTDVSLDQFIFVEDAVPSFWSEKNTRGTYIWIRLRPFAFSLDRSTFKFYVREVWTEADAYYDTRYYEVTSLGTITTFDAGGGVFGLEFYYQPSEIFHHNAIVYVHLEVYDTASTPNYIDTEYWFKIIPDFKSPYIVNIDPDREEDQVAVDTNIYFEIKDDGAGIDINTLEVFLNSRIIIPTTIERVTGAYYKITCDIPYDLQFSKVYSVGVKVADVSENRNYLRDTYRFYTAESSLPWFTGFDPRLCKRGMPRFTDVSFAVLAGGDGVDGSTIRLQVGDKDVTDKSNILPIVYRIS